MSNSYAQGVPLEDQGVPIDIKAAGTGLVLTSSPVAVNTLLDFDTTPSLGKLAIEYTYLISNGANLNFGKITLVTSDVTTNRNFVETKEYPSDHPTDLGVVWSFALVGAVLSLQAAQPSGLTINYEIGRGVMWTVP